MKEIYINENYDMSFLLEYGKDITCIHIPEAASQVRYNSTLLCECPNVEKFIIDGNNEFEFKDGILYSKSYNGVNRSLKYVTNQVKALHITADINSIDFHYSGKGIETITVDEDNADFTAWDNMLFDKGKTELLFVCSNLKSISIPEGVTTINTHALFNCDSLEKIDVPASFHWKYSSLTLSEKVKHPDIIIHNERVTIENGLVICDAGDEFAEAVLYIGDAENCIIPHYLTSLSSKLVKNVLNFTVESGNPKLISVDGVVLDKSGTKLILYPRGRDYFAIPNTVKILGSGSVANNVKLKEITLPEQIEEVEQYAFAFDYNLEIIHTMNPDIKCASADVIACCEKLEKIGGVTYFGNIAMDIDYKVKDIVLREETTEVWGAFWEPGADKYDNLKIETLSIPGSLKRIKSGFNMPFKSITVDDTNQYFKSVDGVLFSRDMKELIRYPRMKNGKAYIVPDGVESIANNAFYNCKFLKSVILPDSVRMIGETAFAYTILLSLELKAQPTEIKKCAIAPTKYYRHGGKENDFESVLFFRFCDIKLPVKIVENWDLNKDEKNLSEFIKTDNDVRRKELFNDVKNAQYKTFMALYLYMTTKDEDCKKYLSRAKKRITKDKFYSDFLKGVKTSGDSDWSFLIEK